MLNDDNRWYMHEDSELVSTIAAHHLQPRDDGMLSHLHQAGVTATTLAQVQARLR